MVDALSSTPSPSLCLLPCAGLGPLPPSQAMVTPASEWKVGQVVFFYFTLAWKVGADNCTCFMMRFFLML